MTPIERVIELKKQGAITTDLRKGAFAGAAFASGADPLGKLVAQLESITKIQKLLGAGPQAPSLLSRLAPFARPLAAVAVGAGLLGASKAYEMARAGDVEKEVIQRLNDEFVLGGRTEEQWAESGLEERARQLYRDVAEIAPAVASSTAATLNVIRPVVQRRMEPFLRPDEIKALVDAHKASRDAKPAIGTGLETVNTIFRILPGPAPTPA